MKKFIAVLSLAFIATLVNAQPPSYDDLKVLYADANYEKLSKEAFKYTEKDDTKKDILPYIWLSKGLYKIHLSSSADPEFKNAYKDALKYVAKGLKYDLKYNDGSTFQEHEEFLDEIQGSLQELIDNDVAAGDFRKAYGWTIRYEKITVNPVGSMYMKGACKFMSDDKTTARDLWQEANKALESVDGISSWSEPDKKMLMLGVLHSAAAMKKGRQEDAARELVNKVAQWFEEDSNWKTRYDEIVNGA